MLSARVKAVVLQAGLVFVLAECQALLGKQWHTVQCSALLSDVALTWQLNDFEVSSDSPAEWPIKSWWVDT